MIQLKHQFKLLCGFVEYHDVPYTGKQHNFKGMTQLAVIAWFEDILSWVSACDFIRNTV